MALYQSARIFTDPQIEVTLNDEQVVVKVQENVTPIEVAITGNAMTHWGQIQGTLSNQADLQTALDAKVPYSGATGNVNLGEYGLTSGYLQFDVTPTTYTPAVGNMGWNDQEGTIDLLLKGGSVSLPLGQKQVARVVNGTGGNVLRSNYQVVKVTGAQGQRLQVNLAQANNDANSADTLGLIAENINNNNAGFIITSGLVENIDTTGALQGETWTDGNILYLSGTTAGRLTNVKPQAPTHTVICGFVVYAHQNNGKIFVKVDNGYELDELHNVKIDTGTLANGQVLKYNSSLQVWENNTDAAGTGTVTSIATSSPITGGTITTSGTIGISQATTSTDGYLSSTDWNTFNNKQNALTNPITGTGTTNELTYFTGSTSVGSLPTATYPSLTELSYVKGVTSAIQTQLNGKQATLINPITGTGTSGQVAYFNGTTSLTSESNLFWDATNDRLGIGTNTPSQSIQTNADISVNGVLVGRGGGSIDTNTRVGVLSGSSNTTGSLNTFVGNGAGQLNSTASSNTFIGFSSGASNQTGGSNTFVGRSSGININSSNNTFVGWLSGGFLTTGGNNSAFGLNAGRYAGSGTTANQTSSNSLYLGYQTRASANGNTNEVVIGYDVVGLGSNTTVLGNSSTVTTGIYGNLLLGSTVTTGERLQVTGTAKITDTSTFTKSYSNTSDLGVVVSANLPGINLRTPSSGRFSFIQNYVAPDSVSFLTGSGSSNPTNQMFHLVSGTNEFIIGNYSTGGSGHKFQVVGSSKLNGTLEIDGNVTIYDGKNIILSTTTGTKIGTATTQKISFWNATPIVQPTTAVASATRVGGGGTTLTDTDTFDGYTLAQIVKALRNTGILS